MRIAFLASDKDREQALARHFAKGVLAHGDECDIIRSGDWEPQRGFHAIAMVGVKSKRFFEQAKKMGATPLMLDKGYIRSRRPEARTWEYWRVSPGAHHPTGTSLIANRYPSDRYDALELELAKWRKSGLQIVFAGSSAKYHDFYGLPDPTSYATDLFRQIARLTDRPIVYRPKPSWRDAVPISGSRFSIGKEGIRGALANAHVLVTHGSNACFEAALMGIPSIVLGDGIAAPISSTSIDDIEHPHLGKRLQWLANLAYHQWNESEMASGQAWETIRKWL